MEILLLPISLFGKHVIKFLPDYFQTIPTVILSIYFIYLLIKQKRNFNLSITSGILLFLLIVLISQGFATIRTILTFPLTGIGVFEKYFQFIFLIFYFLIVYLVLKNSLDQDVKINKFLKGFFFYGAILSILLVIQFIFIQTGWLKSVIEFIGCNFAQGSYSESINPNYLTSTVDYLKQFARPNGLDPEGRDVAIRLAIIVVSFLLAALKNDFLLVKNKNKSRIMYLTLLGLVILLMFAIQTLASLVFGGLSIIFAIPIIIIKKKNRPHFFYKEGAIVTSLIGLGVALIYVFPNATIDLGEANRTASAIALFRVFLHHPLIGVGYDFSSPYAIVLAPEKYSNSITNIQIYLANNQMPALNTVLAWFSQFGLIVILPILFYIIRAKLDFTILIDRMQEAKLNQEKITLYQTVDDLFFFGLIFLIPASFLLFDWRGLSYVMVAFFVLVTKDLLKQQLDILAPLKE
ncbi:MAG: hypothetical protein LBS28_00490 [Streptococcaceae bacterium]|jgi:hypothetical protein|nr:hypothetical protein [Streptococcaceae bacterium]